VPLETTAEASVGDSVKVGTFANAERGRELTRDSAPWDTTHVIDPGIAREDASKTRDTLLVPDNPVPVSQREAVFSPLVEEGRFPEPRQ
jgi:hypothetical protein